MKGPKNFQLNHLKAASAGSMNQWNSELPSQAGGVTVNNESGHSFGLSFERSSRLVTILMGNSGNSFLQDLFYD
jgi:hypothetical protein